MSSPEQPASRRDAVAWVQEVLDTGADETIAPEGEWRWTGRFACHWELDAPTTSRPTRAEWGDGPVQVSLVDALEWAARTADRAVLTIGGQHPAPQPVPVTELIATQGAAPPVARPFERS